MAECVPIARPLVGLKQAEEEDVITVAYFIRIADAAPIRNRVLIRLASRVENPIGCGVMPHNKYQHKKSVCSEVSSTNEKWRSTLPESMPATVHISSTQSKFIAAKRARASGGSKGNLDISMPRAVTLPSATKMRGKACHVASFRVRISCKAERQ